MQATEASNVISPVRGVVGKINSREFNGKLSYSFVLKNASTWYSAGWTAPTFKEGDSIQFEVSPRGNYLDAKNISPWNGAGAASAPPVAAVAAKTSWPRKAFPTKDVSKAKYWEDKAKTDVVTQKRIEIQAARNAAIETSKLLLEHGLIVVPATKKQDGKAYLDALVNELTDGYIANTSERLKEPTPGTLASPIEEEASDEEQQEWA